MKTERVQVRIRKKKSIQRFIKGGKGQSNRHNFYEVSMKKDIGEDAWKSSDFVGVQRRYRVISRSRAVHYAS